MDYAKEVNKEEGDAACPRARPSLTRPPAATVRDVFCARTSKEGGKEGGEKETKKGNDKSPREGGDGGQRGHNDEKAQGGDGGAAADTGAEGIPGDSFHQITFKKRERAP